MIRIRGAIDSDLPTLGRLFDQYRQFYRLPGDLEKSTTYLTSRLRALDSTVLVAVDETGALCGFTQLYPTWCSLLAGPVYVLYDLYVTPEARRRGVGRALIQAATECGRRDGKLRMTLSTAKTNLSAQSLYESLGWERDEEFFVYNLGIV
ncbi:MAG: GNAT family N-acetyltransferase [Gammaproteobacteria bacterium]|nr:GNAT family N-acetyltransferase [Gammaproteobacteria bacterium]MBV9724000.1 GNAT family N-acetyltransferase [Gammaproteobacteria bacterium]